MSYFDAEETARRRAEDERFDRLDLRLTGAQIFMAGVIAGILLAAVLLL